MRHFLLAGSALYDTLSDNPNITPNTSTSITVLYDTV